MDYKKKYLKYKKKYLQAKNKMTGGAASEPNPNPEVREWLGSQWKDTFDGTMEGKLQKEANAATWGRTGRTVEMREAEWRAWWQTKSQTEKIVIMSMKEPNIDNYKKEIKKLTQKFKEKENQFLVFFIRSYYAPQPTSDNPSYSPDSLNYSKLIKERRAQPWLVMKQFLYKWDAIGYFAKRDKELLPEAYELWDDVDSTFFKNSFKDSTSISDTIEFMRLHDFAKEKYEKYEKYVEDVGDNAVGPAGSLGEMGAEAELAYNNWKNEFQKGEVERPQVEEQIEILTADIMPAKKL